MYVCGMYVPSHGGAEISMYSLLKRLKEVDWEVIAVTDSRYEKTKENNQFNKVEIKTVEHKKRVENIEKLILEFMPDVILTQLMWSDVVMKLAKKHKIPSILRICKIPLELDLSNKSEYSPTAIIATSEIVKKYIKKNWNRNAKRIMPLVEKEDYVISRDFKPFNNEYIVMFNPLIRKGGEVFKKIAKRLPNQKFATVLGWSSLKRNPSSNKFSREYIKRITESEGSTFDDSLPDYVDFSGRPNVEIFKSEDDARLIYEKTKILLIPSQWEETFGRVAIEAMVNGIPVIASDIAGLKNAVGSGGILLKKDDVDLWVNEIMNLQNKEYYQDVSDRCKKWVEKSYSEERIVKQTTDLIEKTTGKKR